MGKDGNRKVLLAFLALLIWLGPIASAALSAGQKRTIEIKPGLTGVVGYGTLIIRGSLEQTLGHKYVGRSYPVHVTGFARSWSLRRPFRDPKKSVPGTAKTGVAFRGEGKEIPLSGIVELNISPEKNGRLNGILYLLSEEELRKVDKREAAYRRLDVTGNIEEFTFAGGRVYIYEALPVDPAIAAADPGEYVLFKEYLEGVLKACEAIGQDFRAEFEKSTKPIAYRIISYGDIISKSRD